MEIDESIILEHEKRVNKLLFESDIEIAMYHLINGLYMNEEAINLIAYSDNFRKMEAFTNVLTYMFTHNQHAGNDSINRIRNLLVNMELLKYIYAGNSFLLGGELVVPRSRVDYIDYYNEDLSIIKLSVIKSIKKLIKGLRFNKQDLEALLIAKRNELEECFLLSVKSYYTEDQLIRLANNFDKIREASSFRL